MFEGGGGVAPLVERLTKFEHLSHLTPFIPPPIHTHTNYHDGLVRIFFHSTSNSTLGFVLTLHGVTVGHRNQACFTFNTDRRVGRGPLVALTEHVP